MDISEFIAATSRIETYYGKEYNKEQRTIMFDELSKLDIERYRSILSIVLKKCKYLPKLADIIEIDNEIPHERKEEIQEKKDCKKCKNTGYIIYTKKIKNGDKVFLNQYAAICSCGNAKAYKGWETQVKSNYYIPIAQEIGMEV